MIVIFCVYLYLLINGVGLLYIASGVGIGMVVYLNYFDSFKFLLQRSDNMSPTVPIFKAILRKVRGRMNFGF